MAGPGQLEVDGVPADGTGLLMHVPAESLCRWRHRQSPNQGADGKVKLW